LAQAIQAQVDCTDGADMASARSKRRGGREADAEASGTGATETEDSEEGLPLASSNSLHVKALAAAAGASSGELLTTAVFYPVELVKSRLQAAVQGEGGGYAYAGVVDGLRSIVREEGIQGLFTGLPSVSARALASECATVYFGEFLLSWYLRRSRSSRRGENHDSVRALRSFSDSDNFDGPGGEDSDESEPPGNDSGGSVLASVLLRTLGGWASIALTLPLETVATRVTVARVPLGAVAAVRQLWQEGGFGAFWRGLRVSLLLCLNPALMLTAVDRLRALFLALWRTSQLSWLQAFSVGAAAKLLTMSLVYPLVRGKVLLQARDTKGAGIFSILLRIAKQEGLVGLYKGLGAQLSKSLMSASLKYAVKERTEESWRRLLLGRGGLKVARPAASLQAEAEAGTGEAS